MIEISNKSGDEWKGTEGRKGMKWNKLIESLSKST